ncbi:flavin reductase family protein [Bradyrhizobium sp. Arg237L]|uniref:flavin reductase family protein n=1 Tax=Bradyrhizobium sp. Arg237L TaxID=3003352 RepID=UPI00249DB270|nr:flavin reductase family protein [Bradyrhizobium sp. Arg237L]MDI4232066.1 flavin reductase family protein [Bradyrhizobium sp. Arg237L]
MSELDKRLSLSSVDAEQFRAAMRCIASTVTVITSRADSVTNGMTATAVCSVSASPPCILVVINQANRSHSLIEEAGVFAVNVLASNQLPLAQHFASRPDEPLESVEHHQGRTGVPILGGCAASLECQLESQTKSGTHSIFVGRVVSARETGASPLLYWSGRFASLEKELP